MDLEAVLGTVMAIGLAASLSLMTVGIALRVLEGGTAELDFSVGTSVVERSFLAFLVDVRESGTLSEALMRLGIAALMLTPYSRAVASLVYFATRRDIKYVAITAVVVGALSVLLT